MFIALIFLINRLSIRAFVGIIDLKNIITPLALLYGIFTYKLLRIRGASKTSSVVLGFSAMIISQATFFIVLEAFLFYILAFFKKSIKTR